MIILFFKVQCLKKKNIYKQCTVMCLKSLLRILKKIILPVYDIPKLTINQWNGFLKIQFFNILDRLFVHTEDFACLRSTAIVRVLY